MRALFLAISVLILASTVSGQESDPGAHTPQRRPRTKPDMPPDVIILLSGLAGIAGLVFYLMYRSARPTRSELQAEANENQRWEDHFYLTPRFEEIERRCGWKVPGAIRSLYANKPLLLAKDFYLLDPQQSVAAWHISKFLPARVMTIDQSWPDYPDAFFFAATLYNDLYFVPTRAECESPLPVFLLENTGEIIKVADSAHDFFGWHRVSAELYHRSEREAQENN